MTAQPLRNLNLPAVPPELKSLSPFLQRADELKAQEPIIAYWCCYHAAQLGISAKAKGPAARNYLFSLLAVLETLKTEFGQHDVIINDAASAAYVENFAFKIFAIADNEDRSGKTTKGTAKKFLAAATFLELLKAFDDTQLSESSDDKIRYARWKAADIAKAFREGRNPIPGPASQAESETVASENLYLPETEIMPSSSAISPPPFEYQNHYPENLPVTGVPPEISGPPEGSTSDSANLEGSYATSYGTDNSGVEHPPNTSALCAKLNLTPTLDADEITISPSAPPFEPSPATLPPTPPPIEQFPRPPVLDQASNPQFRTVHVLDHNLPLLTPAPKPEPELTPQQVSQAQKHCRYAISALDYEDLAQARKELREALKIIGG